MGLLNQTEIANTGQEGLKTEKVVKTVCKATIASEHPSIQISKVDLIPTNKSNKSACFVCGKKEASETSGLLLSYREH